MAQAKTINPATQFSQQRFAMPQMMMGGQRFVMQQPMIVMPRMQMVSGGTAGGFAMAAMPPNMGFAAV